MSKLRVFFHWYYHSWLFKPTLWFVGLILFVALMDQVIMPFYVKLGDETELPDVIEMSVDEATRVLTQHGFQVILQDSLYDANHPIGTVIEQNPYPYATVKEGRRVYLTVSSGEKPIIMPKLHGLSPRDAELTLKTYNLELNSKNYVFSDMYPEGVVIGQSYPQGQKIRRGAKIDITISLGKLKDEAVVPELVGKSLYEARKRLNAIGLKIGELIYEEKENILPETILSQSLPAGAKFDPETTIDLVVSKEKLNE